jgi:hypothetical protein
LAIGPVLLYGDVNGRIQQDADSLLKPMVEACSCGHSGLREGQTLVNGLQDDMRIFNIH